MSMSNSGKEILIAVSGSIAAYKACELVRNLTKEGYPVDVIMTAHATKFVGPITFEAMTGKKVRVDEYEEGMAHIDAKKFRLSDCSGSRNRKHHRQDGERNRGRSRNFHVSCGKLSGDRRSGDESFYVRTSGGSEKFKAFSGRRSDSRRSFQRCGHLRG